MTDREIINIAMANGWTYEKSLLYDDMSIEGFIWSNPNHDGEAIAFSGSNGLPGIPDCIREMYSTNVEIPNRNMGWQSMNTPTMIYDQGILGEYLKLLNLTDDNETYAFMSLKRSKGNEVKIKSYVTHRECIYNHSHDKFTERVVNSSINHLYDEQSTLYLKPSPRCLRKAFANFVKDSMETFVQNNDISPNAFFDSIQKSRAKSVLLTFDIDFEGEALNNRSESYKILAGSISDLVNERSEKSDLSSKAFIVETKGGCHLMVNPSIMPDPWFMRLHEAQITFIRSMSSYGMKLDRSGDIDSPIPGTYQRGFKVNLIRMF